MINYPLKKETIAFLPGFGFKASVFQHIADRCKTHQTLLCDLPHPSETDHVEPFLEVVQQLNHTLPDQSILVGWSLGGLLASALCQTFPHKYKKLVLVSSSLKFLSETAWQGIPNEAATQFSFEAAHHLEKLLTKFIRLVSHPHHLLLRKQLETHLWQKRDTRIYAFYLQMLFQADRRAAIQTKTLHIHGTHDSLLPPSCAEQNANYFSSLKKQIMADAGHSPFLSHPNEFTEHLLAFVEADL